jgi:pSer/pThr/pTyr-binding forkhead associated (FHA) protein
LPPGTQAPVQATLLIHDAQGQRAVEMRGQGLTLGSAGDIPVQGRYVSRRHLRLIIEDGRLWAEDAGSTNGVWLGDVRLRARERREICDKLEFRLGAAQRAADLGEQDCPFVMVTRVAGRVPAPGVTPVLGHAPTPVLGGRQPAAGASAPLLRLTLVAAGWRRELPVHRLPFTLGRSRACDCCLPEENGAVSGCHLRLLEPGLPAGVWVEDLASTRGSYLGGERRSGRFLLPLGQPLTLGGASLNDRHQPVELTATWIGKGGK